MWAFWAFVGISVITVPWILRVRGRRLSVQASLRIGKGGLCVITGGGSGLGQSIAYEYAARQYPLLLVGRTAERLEETKCNILKQFGENATVDTFVTDISTQDGCERLITFLQDKKVFHLVNNAGVGQISTDISISDAQTLISTNLLGPVLLSTGIRAGRYIFISSPQGLIPMPNRSVYASSKAGIHNFARSIQMDGLETTIAYPGWIATGLRKNALGTGKPNPQARSARPAKVIAKEIVLAALSGRSQCCLSIKIKAIILLHLFSPELAEKLIIFALR